MNVIEGLRNQDERALRTLMDDYGDMLLRTAFLLLKDRQAAEEAVQDTFLQAYRKIAQLHEPAKLKSWLLTIVLNRCRMRQRTWSWRALLPTLREEQLANLTEPGPEHRLMHDLRNAEVQGAIGSLPYLYREVITLFYYHELSIAEIAEQLKMNENTVKARLARGRQRLKTALSEAGMEGWA